jgi:hypothetical protein
VNFLSPWFLAGALLIAGPIIAHLVRRSTRDRVTFSATRFLDPSAPRFQRRSRVQNPWLLLLRCLIVAALAAGFARPFLSSEQPLNPSAGSSQHVVAVLDESASMQRAGLWDSARERVTQLAADLGPADRFVLLASANRATELIGDDTWMQTPPDERAALVERTLVTRESGWGATHLDTAIESALEQLEAQSENSESVAKKKIVVVSDFAAGTRLNGLSGRVWPAGVEVALERLSPKHTANAGVQWLGWTADTGKGPSARVRISRSREGVLVRLRAQLSAARSDQPIGDAQEFVIPPGEARVAVFLVPPNEPGPFKIVLEGDAEPFDNTVWVVKPSPRELTLAYAGEHNADETKHARFYLERAVAGWRDPVVKIAKLNATNPTSAQVFFVTEPLSAVQSESLRARLEQGAFAVVLLADPSMVATAAALANETGWQSATAGRDDALFGKIDFQHPLFEPFADPRFSDFTRIRFWRPQPLALPENSRAVVVARFDDGSPAVTEVAVGHGRVIVWGGDWAPASSQWVLSTKFVPWLQALVERAAGGPSGATVAEVGDVKRLAPRGAAQWLDSAGVSLAQEPARPGVYQLKDDDGSRVVALQIPAEESRTDPLPLDAFEQLGVPLRADLVTATRAEADRQRAQSAIEIEGQQKLWRWLLIAAATLLALESFAALRLARRSSSTPVEAAS